MSILLAQCAKLIVLQAWSAEKPFVCSDKSHATFLLFHSPFSRVVDCTWYNKHLQRKQNKKSVHGSPCHHSYSASNSIPLLVNNYKLIAMDTSAKNKAWCSFWKIQLNKRQYWIILQLVKTLIYVVTTRSSNHSLGLKLALWVPKH